MTTLTILMTWLAGFILIAPALAQTGAISGVVVSDDRARAPIARAVVTLAGGSLDRNLVVVTDSAGRFTFEALPAGQFTVTASKPTYLSTAYGQRTQGRGAGLPISITAGQRVDTLTLAMPKGAVISGRVLDDSSLPFANVQVVLVQRIARLGEEPRLASAACCTARTDGQGGYRLYGVPAGEYLVAALPRGDYVYMPEPWTANPPEVRETSRADVEWATRRLAGGSGQEPPLGGAVTYTRVFYPGASQPDRAASVSVAAGEERGGIDISMRLLPSARIEGRAVGPDGAAVRNARVSMSGASWGPVESFVSRNLTPGRYTITMRDSQATLWGRAQVDLAGEDVTDLVIRLQPAARITGRIQFESTSTPRPADVSSVRLMLRPASSVLGGTRISPDGTFTISGMDPGRYSLTASIAAGRGAPSSPWVLKSAVASGRDLADVPFDIDVGEEISDVVVTFTDRATELSGTLLDAAGRPAPGFYVIVISRDERFWTPGTRRMPPPARAATDGTFRFAGLPPGSYVLAAVAGAEPDDLADPVFLRQLGAAGVEVTLADGERKTQNVRFAR